MLEGSRQPRMTGATRLGVYSVTMKSGAGRGLERQRRLLVLSKELYVTAIQSQLQNLWKKQTKSSVEIPFNIKYTFILEEI